MCHSPSQLGGLQGARGLLLQRSHCTLDSVRLLAAMFKPTILLRLHFSGETTTRLPFGGLGQKSQAFARVPQLLCPPSLLYATQNVNPTSSAL